MEKQGRTKSQEWDNFLNVHQIVESPTRFEIQHTIDVYINLRYSTASLFAVNL